MREFKERSTRTALKNSKSRTSSSSNSGGNSAASVAVSDPNRDDQQSSSGLPFEPVLGLDLLRVAAAAAHCGFNCSAVLYAEWASYGNRADDGNDGKGTTEEVARAAVAAAGAAAAAAVQDNGDNVSGGGGSALKRGRTYKNRGDNSKDKSASVETLDLTDHSSHRGARKTSRAGIPSAAVRAVLLRAFHALDEPEYVRALRALAGDEGRVNRSGLPRMTSSSTSRVDNASAELLYCDQGDALALLSHCDAALQTDESQHHGVFGGSVGSAGKSSMDEDDSGATTAAAEAAMKSRLVAHCAQALEALGLRHVARAYLSVPGLVPSSSSSGVSDVTTLARASHDNRNGSFGNGNMGSEATAASSLRAKRYAAAWRALDWDLPESASNNAGIQGMNQSGQIHGDNATIKLLGTASSSESIVSVAAGEIVIRVGFDEAVHGALRALAKGSNSTSMSSTSYGKNNSFNSSSSSSSSSTAAATCLRYGRAEVVQQLGVAARHEASAGLQPALVQLQALREVHEAWALVWPSPAQKGSATFRESYLNSMVELDDSSSTSDNGSALEGCLNAWQNRLPPLLASVPTSKLEPLLSVREACLRIALNARTQAATSALASASASALSSTSRTSSSSPSSSWQVAVSQERAVAGALAEHLLVTVQASRKGLRPSTALAPLRRLQALLASARPMPLPPPVPPSPSPLALLPETRHPGGKRRLMPPPDVDGAATIEDYSMATATAATAAAAAAAESAQATAAWSTFELRARLEEAQLLWSRGDADLALVTLKALALDLQQERASSNYSPTFGIGNESSSSRHVQHQAAVLGALERDVLVLLGEWTASTRSGGSEEVVDQFLKPAVRIADALASNANLASNSTPSSSSNSSGRNSSDGNNVNNSSHSSSDALSLLASESLLEGPSGGAATHRARCSVHLRLGDYLSHLHGTLRARLR